jgi:hypothetical protein
MIGLRKLKRSSFKLNLLLAPACGITESQNDMGACERFRWIAHVCTGRFRFFSKADSTGIGTGRPTRTETKVVFGISISANDAPCEEHKGLQGSTLCLLVSVTRNWASVNILYIVQSSGRSKKKKRKKEHTTRITNRDLGTDLRIYVTSGNSSIEHTGSQWHFYECLIILRGTRRERRVQV